MNNDLLLKAREKVPDAKTLIILASRRARQLATGAAPMVRSNSENFLDVALQEIGEGLLVADFSATPQVQGDDFMAQMSAAKAAAAEAAGKNKSWAGRKKED